MDVTAVQSTKDTKPFVVHTKEEQEILANALGAYMDYLTQIGEGVEAKADEHTKNFAKGILGGTMKDTIKLRQRLVKHVGFDPTYE
jgi:hypothetical protein